MKNISKLPYSKIRKASFNQLAPFWPREQLFIPKQYSNQTIIDSVKALEKEGLPVNEFLIISSPKEYLPLYFSQNIHEILGYTSDELLKLKALNFEMDETIITSLIDISHLYSNKNYWGIYEAFNDTKDSLTQVYSNKEKSLDSFLNVNEKAILKLTIEGFTPEKIQELLNMKKAIFDKNCENMLNRTGANDLSALIQLLNYCGAVN